MSRLSHKTLFLLASVFFLLALIMTYANHFSNSFHFDDFHTITDNPYVRNLDNFGSFFSNPNTYSILSNSGTCYRPVCTLLTAIDYKLAQGYNPFIFHLSSFFWYLVQLFFMFILFRAIFNSAFKHEWNDWLALFGTAWYGLHTVNAETVNYFSARSDMLSTAMVIIALVSYMRSPFMRKYSLYLIPFIIGILTKQSALVFAPLLFIYLLLFDERNILRAFVKSLPAFIITLVFYKMTASMISTLSSAINTYYSYLISQPYVILHYFKNYFLPTGLNADYGWDALNNIMEPKFILGSFFIIIMLCAAYYFSQKKKYHPITFGILWFFIALAPTSIMPLTEILNDHRVFFPYVGLPLAVCWAIGLLFYKYQKDLKEKPILKSIIVLICLLILLANALGTRERNKVWKDEESLWYDVTVKSPKNGRGLMNYGLTQMAKGKYAVTLQYFQEALKYYPNYSYLHTNLAIAYAASGDQKKAEVYFKRAIELDPNLHLSYFFYARWLNQQGRQKEAIPLLQNSIRQSPGLMASRYLLTEIYSSLNDQARVKEQFSQILAIDPQDAFVRNYLAEANSPEHHLSLSLAYFNAGDYNRCIAEAKQAIKLKPNFAEAYNNIGAAYNTLQQWDDAIIALEIAVAMKLDFQLAKNNLTWAKQQKARFHSK